MVHSHDTTKQKERPFTAGTSCACGNAYGKHFAKFPDFFETQCWLAILTTAHTSSNYSTTVV